MRYLATENSVVDALVNTVTRKRIKECENSKVESAGYQMHLLAYTIIEKDPEEV